MSDGRYFLDTNVLAYTFDPRAPAKQSRATDLVRRAVERREGVISFQVVQEFFNVALHRFPVPFTTDECTLYLRQVLAPLCEVPSSLELYSTALDLRERWRFSFYDCLILAAALSAGCDRLFTEDLQHGQKIQQLTVIDPFREP
jgi:predicted nucleic acid-binding protein